MAKRRVVDRPRFQHACGNMPLSRSRRNIISQVYGALDRLVGLPPAIAVFDVCNSFKMVGFDKISLQKACDIVALKHLYLKEPLHDGFHRCFADI